MAIAKQNSTNVRSPAMILIGKTQLLLRVQSQRFRRLVRTIAMDCAIRALEEKQLSSKNLPLLKRRYQNAIFSTLAMGRNGCADPQVSIFDAYNFDDTRFWDILMCAWTARQRVLTAPQQARLRRIKKASTTCSVQIVRDGIATLEKTLAVQLEFGISNGRSVNSLQKCAQRSLNAANQTDWWSLVNASQCLCLPKIAHSACLIDL